jgi:hypothetical protein
MEAVILKTGKAVKTTNLINRKHSVDDGMLTSFTTQLDNRDVCYFDEDILEKELKSNFINGYYYVDVYANFANSQSLDTLFAFIDKGLYKDFISAENNDEIKINIISTHNLNSIYNFIKYEFNHNIDKYSYFHNSDGSLGFKPNLYDSNPVNSTKIPSFTSNLFFENHKSYINNNTILYQKIVSCCLRIEMIIDDIYDIFNHNLLGDEFSNLVTSFLNSIKNSWETDVFFDITDNEDVKINKVFDLTNALSTFYIYSFKFQKEIKSSSPLEKLKILCNLAKTEILNSISPVNKIKLLLSLTKSITNEKSTKIKKYSIETILLLIDSFVENENNSNDIDLFLEKIIDEEYGVIINQEAWKENESPGMFFTSTNHIDIRTKISLFEFIYRQIDSSVLVKLWRFSSLHKKITSSFNLNSESLDARSHFIALIYTLWAKSSFNPTKGGVYNNNYFNFNNGSNLNFSYTRKPATTFFENQNGQVYSALDRNKTPLIVNIDFYYIHGLGDSKDTIITRFCDFNRILVLTNDIRHANIDPSFSLNNNIISQFNTIRQPFSFGYYNILQAIQIVKSTNNKKLKFFYTIGMRIII